jgi:hypothetical protein
MIHVISPPRVGGREARFGLRLVAYSASVIASAVGTQIAIAIIGAGVVRPAAALVVPAIGIVSAGYALRELGFVYLPLPGRNWQVPRSWLARGFYSSAVVYGLVLGTGFATRAPFASFQLMSGMNAVLGLPAIALVNGLLYGLSRAGTLVGYSLISKGTSSHATLSFSIWISQHEGHFHALNGCILMVFGVLWTSILYVGLSH